jgi:hypothetical protein
LAHNRQPQVFKIQLLVTVRQVLAMVRLHHSSVRKALNRLSKHPKERNVRHLCTVRKALSTAVWVWIMALKVPVLDSAE